jgi:CheY-like chemotaxis protein
MSAARVLVCDDEPGIRQTLSQILGDEGYAVDAVGLGQEAVQHVLGETPPDAVLLDVWLPDVDGLTVLDRLRAGGSREPSS